MEWYDFFKSCGDDLELIRERISRKDAHMYISHDKGWLRETLLGAAISADSKAAVKVLLELGVDANKPCLLYVTEGRRKVVPSRWAHPLSYACVLQNKKATNDIVVMLLQHGANKDAKNNLGETAYDIAKAYGNNYLMDLLK